MKTLFPLVAAALVLAAPAFAQERTAGQAYDAQVNWGALNSKIDLVSNQNKALAAALDKVMACNAEKKIYAPTDSNADANGCAASGHLEIGAFGESSNNVYGPASPIPNNNAYCVSKGYEVRVGSDCSSRTNPGNHGDLVYTNCTIYCLRIR